MTTNVTPTTLFKASVFYDANNNPLNIPCEGPIVVPVQLDLSLDKEWIINFTQIHQLGNFSCLQSAAIGASIQTNSNATAICVTGNGANVPINIPLLGAPNANIPTNGGGTVSVIIPILALVPPIIRVQTPGNGFSGDICNIAFANFMLPPLYLPQK